MSETRCPECQCLLKDKDLKNDKCWKCGLSPIREIIEKIEPFLRENRGVWAGVDIIGPYLGEINFPSPGLLYRTDIFNENKEGTNYLIENIKKWSPKYDN